MAQQLSTIFASGYTNRSSLERVTGNTPFGYYDNDSEFIRDAQHCAAFVAQRLGVGGTSTATTTITELTVYAAMEEAVTTYGNMVYQWKIRDNYLSIEGSDTSPFNQTSVSDRIVLSLDSNVNKPIFWSKSRVATWAEIGNDAPNSASAAAGEIYVSSASISDFLSPDLTRVKNFNFFYYQTPDAAISNPSLLNFDWSSISYPQYTKVSGSTIISGSGYEITSGSSWVYMFTTVPLQDYFYEADNTLLPQNQWSRTINTAYYQDTLSGNSLNGKILNNNLALQIRIAEGYAQEAGVGGYVSEYTGSIDLIPYQQVYDLNAWADASASIEPGDRIEIRQVFYQEPPAIIRYFDPYAGTGTGVQGLLETFGFGSYSPGINFMLMPVYWDIQKIQAIEFNDQVRKSAFSFELVNNQLRLFPIPTDSGPQKLWFKYMKLSEKYAPTAANNRDNIVADVMSVPYRNPIYSNINQVGRTWIFRYALAICKEIEGQVRATFTNLPSTTQVMNGSELLTDARAEKQDLLTELKEYLEQTTRRSQLERREQEAEFISQTMNRIPLLIYAL